MNDPRVPSARDLGSERLPTGPDFVYSGGYADPVYERRACFLYSVVASLLGQPKLCNRFGDATWELTGGKIMFCTYGMYVIVNRFVLTSINPYTKSVPLSRDFSHEELWNLLELNKVAAQITSEIV